MFLILTPTGVIADITTYTDYIRLQPNGYKICCSESEATGIYSMHTDQFYSMEQYHAIWIEDVPTEVECVYWIYDGTAFVPNPAKAEEYLQRQQDKERIAAVPELQAVVNSILLDQLTAEGAIV